MARAIWTGSISFGLANIPVRLFSAAESIGLDLDMLHETDLSPVRYARICKEEGKEIPYDEIVIGFKLKTGEYVVVTNDDFKKADVKKTATIAIQEFVKEEEISSIYFEKPYYLVPQKGAEMVYSLFREALRRSKKVGIGTFVLRNREHLAALLIKGEAIVLNQLRFEGEIRSEGDLGIPTEEINEKQMEVAVSLMDQMTRKFNPAEFKDTYIEKLKELIEKKAEGKEVKVPTYQPKQTVQANQIMKALRQSLEQEKQKAGK